MLQHSIKRILAIVSLTLICCGSASAQKVWQPKPGWKDSYSVGGICYCDTNNFDHGIGEEQVISPDGYSRSVRQICADIATRFGSGADDGRIPYNTIACGNGPANNAPDEDLITGCPGRVDKGPSGCFDIGPPWSLTQLYGSRMKTLDRSRWTVTSYNESKSTAAMLDGDLSTRWSTGSPQQAGQWIEVDLGADQKVNRIVLDNAASPSDYPRGWSIQELDSLGNTREMLANTEYQGEIMKFVLPDVTLRRFRIVQTRSHPRWYWSVHELHVGYASP